MTNHLMNQTLGNGKESALAAYYRRGMVRDTPIVRAAKMMAAGEMTWQEATEFMMEFERTKIPEPTSEEQERYMIWDERKESWTYTRDLWQEREDKLSEIEGRISYRLDVLADRIDNGMLDAPLAVVRLDADPRVLVGLGIEADGILSNDEINALLAGRKADGTLIEGKKYSVERTMPADPKTGERRWSTPIGSYDFCPSPHKSVSVAWAFANPVEQAKIYNAHIEAAREAVAYLASDIGRARIGNGGEDGYEPGYVIWLEFTHHTARRTMVSIENGELKIEQSRGMPGDPDLHTHFLIPNVVFCDSGRVGSLDTMAIRGFIYEGDGYYQARLATKLRDAGFGVDLDERTGAAKMTVIPEFMDKLFSKRSNIGEAMAQRLSADSAVVWADLTEEQRAARIVSATKSLDWKSNGGKDDVADLDSWKLQAKAAGWEAPASLMAIGPTLPDLTPEQRHRMAYEIGLPWLAKKFEHRSVLPHWDLRLAALRGLVATGTDGLSDIKGITTIMRQEGVLHNGEQTAIQWGKEDGKRYTSVTTALHERDEREFVRLGTGAFRDKSAAIPVGLLNQKIADSGLDFTGDHGTAQRDAIFLANASGRFAVVRGIPGAGKTALLKPLVASWNEMQRDTWGAALAWRQADALIEAGIPQARVKAYSVLIDGLQDGSIKLTENSVVAVDEWGLLGTRQGLDLLRARDAHGFSIVSIGDDKQTGSIEAGSLFDLSQRALGKDNIPDILFTKRQQSDREKEVVKLLRDGDAAQAISMKREDGTAEMVFGGREAVLKRTAELYAERLKKTGQAPTISAPTNTDAHQISQAIRHERRKMGLIGQDQHIQRATDGERDYSLALAAGDHIRLYRSTRAFMGYAERKNGKKYRLERSIGRNGSLVEVVEADRYGVTLKAVDGRSGYVKWSAFPSAHGRALFGYGGASTIHSSQGSTADEHIFALPSGSGEITGAAGYTASTRHRKTAFLVTSEVAERIAVRESRPINDGHEVTIDDKWANVAKNFILKKKNDSALELMDKVGALQRGTVKAFHQAVQRADPQQPNAMPETLPLKRMERAMDQVGRALRHVRDTYQQHQPFQGRSR